MRIQWHLCSGDMPWTVCAFLQYAHHRISTPFFFSYKASYPYTLQQSKKNIKEYPHTKFSCLQRECPPIRSSCFCHVVGSRSLLYSSHTYTHTLHRVQDIALHNPKKSRKETKKKRYMYHCMPPNAATTITNSISLISSIRCHMVPVWYSYTKAGYSRMAFSLSRGLQLVPGVRV